MTEEFVLYQKFTDTESAEDFASELKDNEIEYRLQDINHAYVKVVGYNSVDIEIGLNIRQKDFSKADLVLEKYYARQIEGIDKSYHVFDFTNEELNDIIMNPYDWGRLDYQLAKHILKERGIEVSDDEINIIKANKINELSKTQKEKGFKIVIGYILAFLFPVIAIIIGLTIKYNRKILPNGNRFYNNSEEDRKHAQRIIVVSAISICLYWIYFFMAGNNF